MKEFCIDIIAVLVGITLEIIAFWFTGSLIYTLIIGLVFFLFSLLIIVLLSEHK